MNQLARYEVSGTAEPGKIIIFYPDSNCSGSEQEFEQEFQFFCQDHLGSYSTACMFLLPLIQSRYSFLKASPDANGYFNAILATDDPGATISVTTGRPKEEKSDCVVFTLPSL